MRKSAKFQTLLGLTLCCVLAGSLVFAAEDRREGQRGGERGPRSGQRGGFDRASMQERMLGMMKDRMDVSDEEWTVIKPRLDEVMKLSRNSGAVSGMRMMFGRGRRGGSDREAPTEPVQIAAEDLQKTLEKEAPATAEIKAKLAALRGAREKNKQQLVVAQQKLKEVLTVKQEALMVMMGILE